MNQRAHDIIFYDGTCALCHGWVKFVLKYDQRAQFVFSPLQGETYREKYKPEERTSHPDTVVLLTVDGKTLFYSSGIVSILKKLGGVWFFLGLLLWCVPKPLRNLGYRVVARIRQKVFGRTETLCPLVPEDLRDRFLD